MNSSRSESPPMEVTKDGDVALFRPEGSIDSSSAPAFEEALAKAVTEQPVNILIDLENVAFVASAGLRVFLNTAKILAKQDRALREYGVKGVVQEVFEVSGFISIIDVRENEADARADL